MDYFVFYIVSTGRLLSIQYFELKVFMHQNRNFFVFAIVQNAILFRKE